MGYTLKGYYPTSLSILPVDFKGWGRNSTNKAMDIRHTTILIFAGIITILVIPILFIFYLLDMAFRLSTEQSIFDNFKDAIKRLYDYIINKFL